jgi:hypothetical protein
MAGLVQLYYITSSLASSCLLAILCATQLGLFCYYLGRIGIPAGWPNRALPDRPPLRLELAVSASAVSANP